MWQFSMPIEAAPRNLRARSVARERWLPVLISLLALLSVAAGPPVQRDGVRSPLRLYPHQVASQRQADQWPAVQAQSVLVADLDTNRVLMTKQADASRPMASTTKIMTALLTLERGELERVVTAPAAAQAVGRSRSAASNLLRLLNLAEPVQQMLIAGDLDMGHARALLALDKAHQITHATEVVARKLSVRETEKRVARATSGNGRQQTLLRVKQAKSRDIARLEEELSDLLTAAVEIRVRKRGRQGEQGEVTIAFASLDELNGLIEKLRPAR